MGFKKYRGPVDTVEQAMMAHAVLIITCQGCGHYKREYAFRLWQRAPNTPALPLRKPVAGFRCRRCRTSVEAVMTVATAW